ncbi:O-antigen ligase family protein [Planctellipticum variicoloris]|uniref:O-antigen ligase family protein n=1 Tax=Planctellipticum variicoloris TaxID=3064265 RepID=UPI003013953F|nr:O-antigen ligase family protein [Planctomycetaceae bacterium SH412]
MVRRRPVIRTAGATSPRRWGIREKWQWTTLILLALLPLIPTLDSPVSIVFGLSFGVLILKNLRTRPRYRTTPASTYLLAAFYFLSLISLITATGQGTEFAVWLRGLIPFLFLTSYTCLQGFGSLDDLQDALDGIQLAACIWAAKILVVCGPALIDVMTGQLGRLTYASADTLIPFGLIGYLVALTNPSPRFSRFRWPLLGLFAVLVVTCAYRSHLILCALVTLAYLYRSGSIVLMRVVLAAAFAAFLAAVFAGDTVLALWSKIWIRFEIAINASDMGARGGEIQYAWGAFLKSPIWGNGLGHQVPVEVVHSNLNAADLEIERESAGYIHNVVLYMLMDLGVPGLLAYSLFVLVPICRALKSLHRHDPVHDIQFSAMSTAACLLIYTTCQAAFRLVQFNVVLGLLVAIVCVSEKLQGRPRK